MMRDQSLETNVRKCNDQRDLERVWRGLDLKFFVQKVRKNTRFEVVFIDRIF